ncbi:unnamed protein product [Brassica rapa subsp. trilocularis]
MECGGDRFQVLGGNTLQFTTPSYELVEISPVRVLLFICLDCQDQWRTQVRSRPVPSIRHIKHLF